ncbi:DUF1206 domain-containing protein [Waterburya agarophytonicola K14]|uniref:DUF1206 domain-containing protein n=1 Tax=Waterburya agarophytonicola KI4 TaxID=2874699 RepID=A0A964FGZ8_9CYAN|nr:DUF1206 domain-containing protein [Waterburya agarophytonicola]MCC0179485.1 DUF1206 domain-containing protein [Waterburya agarophytonicola KI4]
METFARFGYAAKGFVYGEIGILALLAAFSVGGGDTTDTSGALQAISQQPFGKILLASIALGLVGYALWRLIQGIKDPQDKGRDAKGIFTRLGHISSGIVYLGVAINAGLLAIGASSSGGESNSKQDWTVMVLQQPLGRWLVGIAGALTIGIGFWRIYRAYKTKFRKKLNLNELSSQKQNLLVNISRFGIAARGVVFVMIGFFIIQAAKNYDPEKVKGLDGALLTLAQQPFGKALLALMALGLICYAIYLLIQARYRRIKLN